MKLAHSPIRKRPPSSGEYLANGLQSEEDARAVQDSRRRAVQECQEDNRRRMPDRRKSLPRKAIDEASHLDRDSENVAPRNYPVSKLRSPQNYPSSRPRDRCSMSFQTPEPQHILEEQSLGRRAFSAGRLPGCHRPNNRVDHQMRHLSPMLSPMQSPSTPPTSQREIFQEGHARNILFRDENRLEFVLSPEPKSQPARQMTTPLTSWYHASAQSQHTILPLAGSHNSGQSVPLAQLDSCNAVPFAQLRDDVSQRYHAQQFSDRRSQAANVLTQCGRISTRSLHNYDGNGQQQNDGNVDNTHHQGQRHSMSAGNLRDNMRRQQAPRYNIHADDPQVGPQQVPHYNMHAGDHQVGPPQHQAGAQHALQYNTQTGDLQVRPQQAPHYNVQAGDHQAGTQHAPHYDIQGGDPQVRPQRVAQYNIQADDSQLGPQQVPQYNIQAGDSQLGPQLVPQYNIQAGDHQVRPEQVSHYNVQAGDSQVGPQQTQHYNVQAGDHQVRPEQVPHYNVQAGDHQAGPQHAPHYNVQAGDHQAGPQHAPHYNVQAGDALLTQHQQCVMRASMIPPAQQHQQYVMPLQQESMIYAPKPAGSGGEQPSVCSTVECEAGISMHPATVRSGVSAEQSKNSLVLAQHDVEVEFSRLRAEKAEREIAELQEQLAEARRKISEKGSGNGVVAAANEDVEHRQHANCDENGDLPETNLNTHEHSERRENDGGREYVEPREHGEHEDLDENADRQTQTHFRPLLDTPSQTEVRRMVAASAQTIEVRRHRICSRCACYSMSIVCVLAFIIYHFDAALRDGYAADSCLRNLQY